MSPAVHHTLGNAFRSATQYTAAESAVETGPQIEPGMASDCASFRNSADNVVAASRAPTQEAWLRNERTHSTLRYRIEQVRLQLARRGKPPHAPPGFGLRRHLRLNTHSASGRAALLARKMDLGTTHGANLAAARRSLARLARLQRNIESR